MVFLAGGGVSRADGRACWAWLSGEGWVFVWKQCDKVLCTVIPRLTKIIRSGITFASRNTHTGGKDKLLEWPDRSCLLLYVSARIH